MFKTGDIHSLTHFQRDTKSYIKQLKRSRRPAVLTVNGKATLVVQDASAYQEMLDAVDRAEAIAGIERGLDSLKRGEGNQASDVFARIRKKHAIPG